MGLTGTLRPSGTTLQSGNDDDWTPTGLPTVAAILSRPHTTYVVRGTGGGVDTSPTDDSIYLASLIGIPGIGQEDSHTFAIVPYGGSEHIASLTFHIRARRLAGSKNLNLFLRRESVNAQIGSTLTLTSSWADYTITSTSDPATGEPWDVADLGPAEDLTPYSTSLLRGLTEMVFTATTGGGSGQLAISRFYITVTHPVGPTSGRHLAYENWRWCDVCGIKERYSRLARPVSPHPQAGWMVCRRCLDEPDHDTRKILSGTFPKDFSGEEPLY